MNRKKASLFDKSIWILLIWTVFQDFALGLIYHYTGSPAITKLIFHSKDVMMVLLYACCFVRRKMTRFNVFVQFSYVILVILQMVPCILKGDYTVTTILASTRALLLLPAFYLIGYNIKEKERFRKNMQNKYLPFLAFAAFIGIIEYLADLVIGTKDFWLNVVQIGNFHADIKGQENLLFMGLPGNFYTYSSKGAFTLKRLVSFWGTPLTSGYCLLIPFLYFFFLWIYHRKKTNCPKTKQRKTALGLIILFTAVLMTVTRAIILPVIAILIITLLYSQKKYGHNAIVCFGILACCLVIILLTKFEQIFAYLYNGSTIMHIKILTNALNELSLLGKGITSFGTTESIGTESTYITVFGQLGILGLLLYLIMFIYPIYRCWKVYKKNNSKDLLLITVTIAGIVYMLTGMISEQLLAYTTIAPFYIMLGCETGYWDEQRSMVQGNILKLSKIYSETKQTPQISYERK